MHPSILRVSQEELIFVSKTRLGGGLVETELLFSAMCAVTVSVSRVRKRRIGAGVGGQQGWGAQGCGLGLV